jgi:hypothetical protein
LKESEKGSGVKLRTKEAEPRYGLDLSKRHRGRGQILLIHLRRVEAIEGTKRLRQRDNFLIFGDPASVFRLDSAMTLPRATFNKDKEEIVQKFAALRKKAEELSRIADRRERVPVEYYEVRTSALNLLARTAGESSIYYQELLANVEIADFHCMTGVITAAMIDFREGFMADTKLLVSAEVFADFLVQAEVLLENDYKDAAAVIIRAVLEDGLRRVCLSKGLEPKPRWGVDDLASQLTKRNVLTAVQKGEIDGKRELGNSAAHGRFHEYTKADVMAFHEFVQRLLATLI